MPILSMFPGGEAPASLPKFTYTGNYSLIDDGDGNWRIKFLTSGTLTFTDRNWTLDAFEVGGGGSGGTSDFSGGGGGGYTNTQLNLVCQKNVGYPIIIGAGGSPGNGGTSSGFGFSASGGHYSSANITGVAGAGGSGGGGYGNPTAGVGGSNGSDGADGSVDHMYGGAGQGTTTREFHEAAGDLYAGGGGGGATQAGGLGGAGGGGNGRIRDGAGARPSTPGTANTGGGGGGGCSLGYSYGGSGVVIIRNHRAV